MVRRYGEPLTEKQRKARHKSRFGTTKLPPRGSGLKTGNPKKCYRVQVGTGLDLLSKCLPKKDAERYQRMVDKGGMLSWVVQTPRRFKTKRRIIKG